MTISTARPIARPNARVSILAPIAFAFAAAASLQAAAGERALTWTEHDAALEWAPCPDFMPEGCRLAVLHGDPAQDNADIFFQLPPGSTAPHHRHTSAERMVLVSGELHVDYDGQEPAVLQPGTYAYGPPGLAHTATCVSAEPCTLFIGFEQPVDAVAVGSE